MFGNARYDPKASWRREPATEAQCGRLGDLGVNAPRGLTKGEASDLISASIEPEPDEVEFLKFFGVKLPESATQLDARGKIIEIVGDPKNKINWDARPASSAQKDIIRLVDGRVPRALTLVDADKIISAYWDDEEKSERYEAAQAALDEAEHQEDVIRDLCENINDAPSMYGLRRVSMRAVKEAVGTLEQQTGYSVAELNNDTWFVDRVAEEIRRADPSKASQDAKHRPELYRPWIADAQAQERPSAMFAIPSGRDAHVDRSGRGSWLGGVVTAVILIVLIASCTGG